MSEKRFELVSVCGDFGIIDTITDDVWFFETYESVVKVVDLLNEQQSKIQLLEKVNEDLREVNKENQLLHEENVKQCERWKNLYELKDSEVTARVDALNKVCEYYTSEVLFKSDTDPNKAVKEVINRILNTEVEKMSTSMTENKNCGTCKHLQIDGMFGIWCDKRHNWENNTNANCSDWESKK